MFYLIYKITNNINGKIYIGAHKTENKKDLNIPDGWYKGRFVESKLAGS